MPDTIIVLTRKTIEEIVKTGGSQYWRLAPTNAKKMTYLVCARNIKGSDGQESHGAGFLIGRISGVVATSAKGRYLIQFSEWAKIDRPELWTFGRNPVHYLDLSDLDIDPETIDFEPAPKRQKHTTSASNGRSNEGLTIQEVKRGLALALGVGVDAIEITIRL